MSSSSAAPKASSSFLPYPWGQRKRAKMGLSGKKTKVSPSVGGTERIRIRIGKLKLEGEDIVQFIFEKL